jgi:putative ABC transport system permease protein
MHGTNLIGRLKPGLSTSDAEANLKVIGSRIEQEHNASHAGTYPYVVPLQEEIVGNVRPVLLVLLAAVGFVLLIACANVASLLLTRSLSRQKEVAIRSALGASRWRVIRQLLTESLLLSLVGGAAGLLIAYWGVPALVAVIPQQQLIAMPFLRDLHLDTGILAFSFGLSLITGLVFGLAPALQSSRLDLNEVLKEGGSSTTQRDGCHRDRACRGVAGRRGIDDEESVPVVTDQHRFQPGKRDDDDGRVAAVEIYRPKPADRFQRSTA